MSDRPWSAPVPRHKIPVAPDKTLAHWLALKSTLPRCWPLGHFTREQVQRHCQGDDCWVVLHGMVFDITAYLPYHPGGANVLLEYAGQDISVQFST
jgi:cytochrome b involved in lipid metabolism